MTECRFHHVTLAGLSVSYPETKIDNLFSERPIHLEGYEHHSISPNATLTSAFGNSFSIQTFMPVTPDTTKFTSLVFSTSLKAPPTPTISTLQKTINDAIISFNPLVFNKDICKEVQKGVKFAVGRGCLSDLKNRVHAFQERGFTLKEISYGQ